jgi:hypothetical protein
MATAPDEDLDEIRPVKDASVHPCPQTAALKKEMHRQMEDFFCTSTE